MVQLYVSHLRRLLRERRQIAPRPRLRAAARRRRGRRRCASSACWTSRARARRSRCGAASALADVADEPFAAAEIRRLDELRLQATERAIDEDLAAGRHAEVIGELDALVAEEPLRERLHAQRMLALYRSGRQAEALAAYRDARAKLVEQVGVEPGAELQRLQDAILAQDPALDVRARRRGAAAGAAAAAPATLRLLVAAAVLLLAGVDGVRHHPGRSQPDGLPGIDENAVGLIDPDGDASRAVRGRPRPGRGRRRRRVGVGRQRADGTVSRIDRERDRGGDDHGRRRAGGARVRQRLAVGRRRRRAQGGAGRPGHEQGRAAHRRRQRAARARRRRRRAVGGIRRRRARPADRPRPRPPGAADPGRREPDARSRPAPVRCGSRARRPAPSRASSRVRAASCARSPSATGRARSRSARARSGSSTATTGRCRGSTRRRTRSTWAGACRPRPDRGRRRRRRGVGRRRRGGHGRARRSRTDRGGRAVDGREQPGGDRGRRRRGVGGRARPAAAHRGGTLRVRIPHAAGPRSRSTGCTGRPNDVGGPRSSSSLAYDGLVGYRRVGGAAGATLVGALATSVPAPSARRPDLRLHAAARAALLRRQARPARGLPGLDGALPASHARHPDSIPAVLRRASSARDGARPARSLRPLRGIETDARARTITIHLTRPDGDFLHKLTMPVRLRRARRQPAPRHGGRAAGHRPVPRRRVGPEARRNARPQPLLPTRRLARAAAGFADRIEVRTYAERDDRAADRRGPARRRPTSPSSPTRSASSSRRERLRALRPVPRARCTATRRRSPSGCSSTCGGARSTISASAAR